MFPPQQAWSREWRDELDALICRLLTVHFLGRARGRGAGAGGQVCRPRCGPAAAAAQHAASIIVSPRRRLRCNCLWPMAVTGLFAHIPPPPHPAEQTLPEPWKAGCWLTLVPGQMQPPERLRGRIPPQGRAGEKRGCGDMPGLHCWGPGPSLGLASPPQQHERKWALPASCFILEVMLLTCARPAHGLARGHHLRTALVSPNLAVNPDLIACVL